MCVLCTVSSINLLMYSEYVCVIDEFDNKFWYLISYLPSILTHSPIHTCLRQETRRKKANGWKATNGKEVNARKQTA